MIKKGKLDDLEGQTSLRRSTLTIPSHVEGE